MSAEQVHKLTHQMRLFGMHAAVERRANEALSAQMHPVEFLRLVLEDELLSRKDRVGKMLTTRAQFRIPSEQRQAPARNAETVRIVGYRTQQAADCRGGHIPRCVRQGVVRVSASAFEFGPCPTLPAKCPFFSYPP